MQQTLRLLQASTCDLTTVQLDILQIMQPIQANTAGTLTQSQTGKWLPARQQSNRLMQAQGWNPRMLDQAGALESPGTDSTSSISPELSGNRRSRRRHKKRSKRAVQLLAESLDSAAEIRSSPEHYSETHLGFQSVHNVLHPDSPEEGAPGFRQGFGGSSQDPKGQSRSSAGADEWSGLKGYLHAAQQGQGGLFAAEALRRMSQDSGGVRMLFHPSSVVYDTTTTGRSSAQCCHAVTLAARCLCSKSLLLRPCLGMYSCHQLAAGLYFLGKICPENLCCIKSYFR